MNLSSYVLDSNECEVLARGLTFIPTDNRVNSNDIENDLNKLIRNVKLKAFFAHADKPYDPNVKKFTNPSTYVPPNNKLTVETLELVNNLRESTNNIIAQFPMDERSNIKTNASLNMTPAEYEALRKLSAQTNIIIKPADKGKAVVIQNRSDYIFEAEKQLSDPNYYKLITAPLAPTNIEKLTEILNELCTDNFITKNQCDFLMPQPDYKNRHFYLLPKIHKAKESWTIPHKIPPGRPIVSDCGSESSHICSYIDSFLTPLATKHDSYIKDTLDFISKIRGKIIPKNSILFTGDVTSLYTNMELGRTMEVVVEQLRSNPVDGRPDSHILNLLQTIIYNNDFEFNGKTYLQMKGISMGRAFCPALANLYLLDLDYQGMHGFKIKPVYFFRFLDDIWGVFPGTVEELKEYETWLSTRIPGINVTLKYHTEFIDFLDLTVYKCILPNTTSHECQLQTKVFFKETDSHQLLHCKSYHPPHTARGVVKSQILRYKRLSSTYTDFKHSCEVVFKVLTRRGYSRNKLIKARNEIWKNNQKRVQTEKKPNILPLITKYNQVGQKLTTTWRQILTGSTLDTKNRFIRAYKNGRNLKSYLVKSRLVPIPRVPGSVCLHGVSQSGQPSKTQTKNLGQQGIGATTSKFQFLLGFDPCRTVRCQACKVHANSPKNTVFSTTKKINIKINQKLSCYSKNIIYVITCKKCNIQYVGETARSLRERLTDHRSNIKSYKHTTISSHFSQMNHAVEDLEILPIEKIPDNPNSLLTRKQREKFWILKLGTQHPLGLNGLPLNDP